MASKNRTIQHVYEIAKRIADSDHLYFEALRKTTSTESKTMERGGEYGEGDFACDYALEGYSVLLIDDTYGEGATLKACIRALKNSGAGAIYFLSLCKNTKGGIKHSDDHRGTHYDDDIPF
jgi:predicted amidophosphoribosyltransferase